MGKDTMPKLQYVKGVQPVIKISKWQNSLKTIKNS